MDIITLKSEILKELRNPNVYLNDILRYVEENIEDAFNICCRKNLSINEKYPDSRYQGQKGQKTVFLTVRMFDLWESAIVDVFNEILINKFKEVKVEPVNDPIGDMRIILSDNEEMRWEIKSGQAPDYFTGATHSASKCNNYILINYEMDKNMKLNQVNKNFITKIAVFVWDNMEEKWLGKPSKNNSFTKLNFPIQIQKNRPEIVVVGKLIPKKKLCYIERKNL